MSAIDFSKDDDAFDVPPAIPQTPQPTSTIQPHATANGSGYISPPKTEVPSLEQPKAKPVAPVQLNNVVSPENKNPNDNPISNVTMAAQCLDLPMEFNYEDGRKAFGQGNVKSYGGKQYYSSASSYMCRAKCGDCEVLSSPHPQKKDAKVDAAALLLIEIEKHYGDWQEIKRQKKMQKEAKAEQKMARVMGRGRGGFGNRPAPYNFNGRGGGRGNYAGTRGNYQNNRGGGNYNNGANRGNWGGSSYTPRGGSSYTPRGGSSYTPRGGSSYTPSCTPTRGATNLGPPGAGPSWQQKQSNQHEYQPSNTEWTSQPATSASNNGWGGSSNDQSTAWSGNTSNDGGWGGSYSGGGPQRTSRGRGRGNYSNNYQNNQNQWSQGNQQNQNWDQQNYDQTWNSTPAQQSGGWNNQSVDNSGGWGSQDNTSGFNQNTSGFGSFKPGQGLSGDSGASNSGFGPPPGVAKVSGVDFTAD